MSDDTAPPAEAADDTDTVRDVGTGLEDRLPWQGRPARADLLCWFGISLSGLYYLALIPVKPMLVGTHPLLLELIGGSTTAIVAAGAFARVGEVPLVLAVVAAVPGMMIFDPLYWWAGRRWGRRVIGVFVGHGGRGGRLAARCERLFGRFGALAVVAAYFLPVPAAVVYALAGLSGMRLVTFLLLDAAGLLIWVGLFVGLGYAMGQGAVDVAHTISHYALWVSLSLVALVIVGQVWRGRRRRTSESR